MRRQTNMKNHFLIATMIVAAGCATYDDPRRALQMQMREVVVEDGINAQEADIIAQSYYLRFGWGCGTAAPVAENDSSWIAKTYVGPAAEPREPIRIDKRTGRVTWS